MGPARRIEVLAFYFLWFCNMKTSDDSCWISYNMQVSDQPILYYFSFCANFFGGFLWRKVWFLKKFCEGKSYSLEFLRRKVWYFSEFLWKKIWFFRIFVKENIIFWIFAKESMIIIEFLWREVWFLKEFWRKVWFFLEFLRRKIWFWKFAPGHCSFPVWLGLPRSFHHFLFSSFSRSQNLANPLKVFIFEVSKLFKCTFLRSQNLSKPP